MFASDIKILVVDDMSTMRKIVQKALNSCGFSTIVTAKDGADAWDTLRTHGDFGLIVSDWNMPNMSGLEFLKKVRAEEKFQSLPFVLLTAEADTSQVQEALQAGVDNYIVKPFSAATLKEKLESTYKKLQAKQVA